MDIKASWDDGLRLGEAWFILRPEEEKERYRDSGNNQALAISMRTFMQADLLRSIFNGELSCIGVQIAPVVGKGPERIPSHLFFEPDVDWGESKVSAFGLSYGGVRVVWPNADNAPSARMEILPTKKFGRPSFRNELRAVVRALLKEGMLANRMRKEQETIVRERARRDHPQLFRKEGHPSRGSITTALKAEGMIGSPSRDDQKV